jgi:thiol:disulfide interchange protein DsbD
MWGAPVNMLSGITPPGHYQEFTLKDVPKQFLSIENKFDQLARRVSGSGLEDPAVTEIRSEKPITVLSKMKPSNALDMWFDYSQALRVAKALNKPLFVDFTGWGCNSCRRMEDMVWSQDRVWQILNNDYVIVSLYVDEKKSLPDSMRQSPSWYELLDHNEKQLVAGRGYTPNVEEYARFLQAGVDEFKRRNGSISSR